MDEGLCASDWFVCCHIQVHVQEKPAPKPKVVKPRRVVSSALWFHIDTVSSEMCLLHCLDVHSRSACRESWSERVVIAWLLACAGTNQEEDSC